MSHEISQFLNDNPDIEALDAFVIDLCGNAVGKRLPRSHMASFVTAGAPLCAAMQLLDVLGETSDPMGYGFSNGDPDAVGRMIPGTLSRIPWSSKPRAQCLMVMHDDATDAPLDYEPRQILKNVLSHFEARELTPVCAVEMEFYLVEQDRGPQGELVRARSLQTGREATGGRVLSMDVLDEYSAFLDAIVAAAAEQNIPVTSMINEYGAGQFEVNLHHQSDALRAADDAALLRRLIVGVAKSFGKNATFMSKPFHEDSGSGMHVHLSLVDKAGNNVFAPDYPDADARLAHAIGGMQAGLGESMAIFAPNINAWRRFGPDLFVPVTRDWGLNNRSVAFRIPPGEASARRIEHRASGAEANPYLVLAAILASVDYGLTHQLDPGAAAEGNACSEQDPELPSTLWGALAQLKAGSLLPAYLGVDYPALYAAVKEAEFERFMSIPTEREYEWYL
jgi:glutamine synthetase